MPVFNGERFLEEGLTALLEQSFDDFELVIADNASTDATEKICRDFASRDSRIRYVRNETNFGYIFNFNKVFLLTSAPYFKWAAYDDVCARDFLRQCVERLDDDLSLALVYSRTAGIDEEGNPAGLGPNIYADQNSPASAYSRDPAVRFKRVMTKLWSTEILYGVMRSEALAKTRLHAPHYMGDHILLSELVLYGRFFELQEELFFIRVHPERIGFAQKATSRITRVQPSLRESRLFLAWKMLISYPHRVWMHASAITRSPLTLRQKLSCYAQLIKTSVVWVSLRAGRKLRVTRSDTST